ncbi:MAG: hypothetical protein OXH63_23980 [Gemmatimonadetes bacterium]|nr:hypothetical protein [Gemmatimonadota bacterium]
MQLLDFITPGLVLAGVGLLYKVVRDMGTDLRNEISNLRSDIRGLNQRLDNHLEGHAPKP